MQKFFVQKIVLLIDRFQTDAHCIVRFHKNVVSKFLAVVKVSYHSYYSYYSYYSYLDIMIKQHFSLL